MPFLFIAMWVTGLLRAGSVLSGWATLTVGAILSAVILSAICVIVAWSQGKEEQGWIGSVDTNEPAKKFLTHTLTATGPHRVRQPSAR
jgi:glycerol uptake facilitator-like aquaporin